MTDEWVVTTLGEETSFAAGYSFPERAQGQASGAYPFYKVSDMNRDGNEKRMGDAQNWVDEDALASIKARVWPRGTVIFPKVGAALLTEKRRLLDRPAAFDNNIMGLVAGDRILPEYLYAILCTVRLGELAQQGAVPSINQGHIRNIALILPPLPVQRRIVDLTTNLDRHLVNLRAEASRAEALALEATNTYLTSLRNEGNALPLSRVWALDCDVERVSQGSAYRVAGVLNAGQGLIDKGTVTSETTRYSRMARLRAGQVLMRRLTAWEGPIAVVPSKFDGFYVSNEFPTFTINQELMDVGYAEMLCRWPGLWHEMRQRVTGSVMRRKRLNPDQLLSVEVSVGPLSEQRVMAEAVAALRLNAEKLNAEADDLQGVRSIILAVLLDGSLEMPDTYDAVLDQVA